MDSVKRISLVKPVADILNVEIGDHVIFHEVDGVIVIEKAPNFEQELNLKEKMKILKKEELEERNRLLQELFDTDKIRFEQKDEKTLVLKIIDAPNPEKEEEMMIEMTKTLLDDIQSDRELILDRLNKLGDMDIETFVYIVEGGDIYDRITEGLDKYPEEEQNEILKRLGKMYGFDDEEFINVMNTISAMSPQEIDKIKRRMNKNEKKPKA